MKSLALALCAALQAQVVTVQNHHTHPFRGWIRATVDAEPASPSGQLRAPREVDAEAQILDVVATYRVGRRVGLDTWIVDIHTALGPGERRALDLSTFEPVSMPALQLPANPVEHFGGMPEVSGTSLSLLSLQPDGAAVLAHLRGRIASTRMMVADLWLWWYPDQPVWCHGEALVTCSNPTVPDMTETTAVPLRLTFGDSQVAVLGGVDGMIVPTGTAFGDGQSRAVPVTFVWQRHLPHADWKWPWNDDESRWIADYFSSEVAKTWHIGAGGISRPLFDGSPRRAPGWSPAAWASAVLPDTIARIHDWRSGTTGPAKRSGDTGAQPGDQVFVGFKDATTHLIRYLGALKMAARPCHHREADGRPLEIALHPNLKFWDGRAHWHTVVSPDQLGKPRQLSFDQGETSGWWGPDVQHWFINTMACAARTTGSPCVQELLRAQATAYMLQATYAPITWSTSSYESGREVGWEGIGAVHLWRELEDRALAATVRNHWQQRFALVMVPRFNALRAANPGGWYMCTFLDDPRMGPGLWYSGWQDAVGAYGLDLAGRVFGVTDASMWARRFAGQVVQDCYVLDGTRWESSHKHPCSPAETEHDESFNYFGLSMAPAVLLRYEPTHEKARAIWTFLNDQLGMPHQASWLVPQ